MTEYTCDSFRFFNLFPVYFGGKGTTPCRINIIFVFIVALPFLFVTTRFVIFSSSFGYSTTFLRGLSHLYPSICPILIHKNFPQHQTSTTLSGLVRENRVTLSPPRFLMCSPTSTPKPRAEGSSPSAPAKKPAKTLGFRRFSFCMCCMVMWFTLVQTLAFSIRFYPFSTVLIPSSTQNAPGFAFFGPNRVRFSLSRCFGTAKFLPAFLCILLYSGYKLKLSVIPCRREVSFLT